jgi:hypothetical protein
MIRTHVPYQWQPAITIQHHSSPASPYSYHNPNPDPNRNPAQDILNASKNLLTNIEEKLGASSSASGAQWVAVSGVAKGMVLAYVPEVCSFPLLLA